MLNRVLHAIRRPRRGPWKWYRSAMDRDRATIESDESGWGDKKIGNYKKFQISIVTVPNLEMEIEIGKELLNQR
eukprot:1195389-Prorocentrum_minimum.AAC.1